MQKNHLDLVTRCCPDEITKIETELSAAWEKLTSEICAQKIAVHSTIPEYIWTVQRLPYFFIPNPHILGPTFIIISSPELWYRQMCVAFVFNLHKGPLFTTISLTKCSYQQQLFQDYEFGNRKSCWSLVVWAKWLTLRGGQCYNERWSTLQWEVVNITMRDGQCYNERWSTLQWEMVNVTMRGGQHYNERWPTLQYEVVNVTMRGGQRYNARWSMLQREVVNVTMRDGQRYSERWSTLQWEMVNVTMRGGQCYNERWSTLQCEVVNVTMRCGQC